MIDGAGPVGEPIFAERMPGLYTVAYTIHFALKRRGLDEHVWPLELLMWTVSGATDSRWLSRRTRQTGARA